MLRSLSWYWRTNLALAAGCAVATSVLTGALIVGDSVRTSLEELSRERLGGIGSALIAPRFLREEVAAELGAVASEPVAPVIMIPGSATDPSTGRRASGVTIVGLDQRFGTVYGETLDFDRPDGAIFPPVIVNAPLAAELGATAGEDILLSFAAVSSVPRETLVGRRESATSVDSLRVTVVAVLEDRGLGRFSLGAGQASRSTAFLPLERLQRAVDRRGRINGLVAQSGDSEALDDALASALTLDDLGLQFRRGSDDVVVESRELILPGSLGPAVLEAASGQGATTPVFTYLATAIDAGDRSLPYSTVAALPVAVVPGLELVGGGTPAPLAADDLLLNEWAASELGAAVGDRVDLTYFRVGAGEELSTERASFRLVGVVSMRGLGADPTLTPDIPGLSEARDISAWDPPFPVDLSLVRTEDEEYWDDHRAAPKAFIARSRGLDLWANRFGDLTSVRVHPVAGATPGELEAAFERSLLDRFDPGRLALTFRPVRRLVLDSSRGATDFSQLFLGFSMFLIASAALLSGLLFRLGLEERAREVGILRATGFPARALRRRLLGQGMAVALLGTTLGTIGAVVYAALMMHGLRTWWLPAIGRPVLFLHLESITLLLGAVISLALIGVTILVSLRRLGRTEPARLLAGRVGPSLESRSGQRRAGRLSAGGLGLGLSLLVATAVVGGETSPGLAFAAGAALLVGGIAAYASRAAGPQPGERAPQAISGPPLLALGARNAGRFVDRSVLSVALVAAACFVIVLVAANRTDEEVPVRHLDSGAGGYSLMATSDVPIVEDLARPEVRADLGFDAEQLAVADGVDVTPFRVRPGEDTSCLNLYRPTQPRIVGATAGFLASGRFRFRATTEPTDDPWSLLRRDLAPGVVPVIGDFNSVRWILHKQLGDDIPIRAENGDEVLLRVVGLLDRSIFQSELVLSEEAFTTLFPSRSGYGLFLIDAPRDREDEIAEVFEAALGRYGLDVVPTAERLRELGAVERTYLSTFQSLGGLGLLLGTIGLGIVMLRNVNERRGELAALRAFGFRPTTLAAVVLVENALLLAVGILIGTVAGLAAGAPNILAGHRTVPWTEISLTLLAIWIVGLTSTLAAAHRAATAPLLGTLKEE